MAYSDSDESSVGIHSRSGSWQIDSGSSDYGERGVAPAPKIPAFVGGRRRNPRRKVKERGSFRSPSELRSDDSVKVVGKKKRRGVALAAPKVPVLEPVGGRLRNTRKKTMVLVPSPMARVAAIERSSEVSGEEEEEDDDGEDPVVRMRAMVRLPAVLIQVRKYGENIVDICNQMEGLLLEEGKDEEMNRLKQKLNKLSEKCYQKVRAEFDCEKPKESQPRLSRRDKHKPKPVVESDDDSPIRPRRLVRSNSVDYTDMASPDDSAQPDESHQPDESAKDSGNPSSGQDESPTKNYTDVGPREDPAVDDVEDMDESGKAGGNPSNGQVESPRYDTDIDLPEAPAVDEPQDMELIRDAPAEETYESSIMDITDPDCNLFFDTQLMAEVCPPPTDSMINETTSINDDIFRGLQNDHDAYTTPIHREIVPPSEPARPASPKKRVTQECNTTDTPTTSIGLRTSPDSHRRRVLPAACTPVVQQSLERYFPKKPVEPVDQLPVVDNEEPDDEVQFVSATAGRRQKHGEVQVKSEPEPEPKPVVVASPPKYEPKPVTIPTSEHYSKPVAIPTTQHNPEPGPSKAPSNQWMVRKLEAKGPKFVTNSDPNPDREPTSEELQYIVPHQPKFSVPPAPQGENPDLELMKNEIECRTRIPEYSWATQKAIREECQRAKRVKRNNDKLRQQLQQYQTAMPENQLILDYDGDSKTFIRVHPELVEKMKPHQREGVKFMYDCCYGGALDVKYSNGSGCILAHCMGLGKTLQVIALMNTVVCYPKMKTKRIIVICPKSTVMNWAQEIQHWLGDIQSGVKLKVFFLPDSSNISKKLEVLRAFHAITGRLASVLLIGYEAFRSLVFYDASNRKGEKHSEGVRAEVRRVLINPGPDLVILDEGHIIKNRKSQTNLSVAEIATKRRIILTGTPIQNNLNEYYCMVNFVKPAFLGSEREFNEHYATPIKNGQHADSLRHEVNFMKRQSFVLHKNLIDFVQRKEFEVLRGFLPQKYEYVLYVPLTPVQEDLYEQYLKRNPLRQETGGAHLLEDYTFMRKIWTHPIVLERAWETAMKKKYGVQQRQRAVRRAHGFDSSSEDDDDDDKDRTRAITNIWWKQIISADDLESLFPSNKMILLFEILRLCQERGEKCLIFSGYVMVLNMVEHFMKMIDEQGTNPKAALYGFSKFRGPWRPGMDFYRIDGGTSKSTRHEMVTKFNDPKNRVTRVFLISTKAGGQGINLVGANRVIILDTSWNPAVDQQGIFRIYRLGQQKPCYIYRLLAMHTMEEKVYSRAVTKQAMSHRVADKKQVDRNYSMADLEELYHFERVDMAARPNSAPAEDELLSKLLWNHHKLIYRYHMHETMLDNKTEEDLTEAEKKVAWQQFKSKNLSTGAVAGLDLGCGDVVGLGPTDSQLSDPDVYSQVLTELDLACAPNYDGGEDEKPELPTIPEAIPVRQMDRSICTPATPTPAAPVERNATIFGDDPYDTSFGGGLSIIEEQRQRMSLKPEPVAMPTVSQVSVSAAEVEMWRELEESAATTEKVKDEDYEPPAKKKLTVDVPVLETVDLLNLSYEGDTEEPLEEVEMVEIPPSIPALKSDSFSSMIEYDPVGNTQELATYAESTTTTTTTVPDQIIPTPPVSYAKFKASLVEDPSVTTSTTTASPAAVVVAICSSPAEVPAARVIMTRSMKRAAAAPLKTTDVPAKKIRVIDDGSLSSVSCEANRCRALVPFTGPRIAMNPVLKGLLACSVVCANQGNPCRALVPYVPRMSLLAVILAQISELLSFSESDSEEDSSSDDETESTSSSYPIGLLTQTSTLSWTAADLEALDEHMSEYYTALSDLEDEMDFTQHSLTDSQREAVQQARDEKEHAELMASLHETRQVVTAGLQESCLAVVPYNPPVSLLRAEEEDPERKAEHEPKAVVFHASLAEALSNGDSRGLKRKREKELPKSAVDTVVWKKPRTSKVYRAKRRPMASIPIAIDLPVEEPEQVTAKLLTANTTLSWGDEEVDFVDWNISCGDIELCERERQQVESESTAIVPYKPASSKLRQPRLVVVYGPIRSFWDPKLLSGPLLPLVNERKGQILKAQHNKLFRFAPYDKRDRKWRKVEKVVEVQSEENTCRSLVVYAGSWRQRAKEEEEVSKVRFVLHPLLVGYLSFCRYVTQHSTMREVVTQDMRGTKRKVDWEESGDGTASMKRPRAVNSAP